jgi:hypothetical protein
MKAFAALSRLRDGDQVAWPLGLTVRPGPPKVGRVADPAKR